MFRFPDASPITINGPFWSAEASVVRVAAASSQTLLPVDQFTAISPPGAAAVKPVPSPLSDDTAGKTVLGTASTVNTQIQVAEFAFPGSADWSRYAYTGRLRVTDSAGGASAMVLSVSGGSYVLRGRAGQPFELQKRNGTVFSRLGQPSNVNLVPNTWFRFRLEVDSTDANNSRTRIRVKVFADQPAGTTGPADFQIDGIDNGTPVDPRLTAGSPAVAVEGPGNKFFTDLQIEFPDSADDRQLLRRLFSEIVPRTTDPQRNSFTPRTAIALCAVSRVRIDNRDALVWSRTAPPRELTEAQIETRITSGELNLFLLQGNPEDWLTATAGRTFACLAGEIDLRHFQPTGNALATLYDSLLLDQGTPAAPAVFAHSSGISVVGGADLLWQRDRVRAAWLLRRIPPASPFGPARFQLSIEKDRLDQPQRGNLIRAWRRLSEQLNPEFPLLKTGAAATTWVTLEAPDLQALPPVFRLFSSEPWNQPPPSVSFGLERGSLNLLLSDQRPYGQADPPSSLARITGGEIVLQKPVASGPVTLLFNPLPAPVIATPPQAAPPPPKLTYTFNAGQPEKISLENLELSYDTPSTARALRSQQGIATPLWEAPNPLDLSKSAQPLSSPLLWAFMPLEEGWAQLPVPNLTEQIYLDSKVARQSLAKDAPSQATLQGALAIGNRPGKLSGAREQQWNFTVTDGKPVTGTWTLAQDAGGVLSVSAVSLTIESPRVVIEGLCWFSTGRPTVQDALPDLDNWVSGLESISLQTVDRNQDVFPAVFTFAIKRVEFSLRSASRDASLGAWDFAYQADKNTLNGLVTAKVFPGPDPISHPGGVLAEHPPLVWRRHAALPVIQALPLTQSQNPPNHPSASRQLAPFALKTRVDSPGASELSDGWLFGVPADRVTPALAGSAQFAVFTGQQLSPAWPADPDLPGVALSLPGVVFEASSTGDRVQYRYDLPYTDQLQALAQTPKTETDGEGQGNAGHASPLVRETFSAHWDRLSTLASLAALDAAKALAVSNGNTVMRGLIEPLDLPSPTIGVSSYPGTLTVSGVATSGDAALEGVSGAFSSGTATFQVKSGSMAAAGPDAGRYRDQRGLSRGPTGAAAQNASLLLTPVELAGSPSGNVALATLLTALTLTVRTGEAWKFWFRDLPVSPDPSAAGAARFQRTDVVPNSAFDVNDPDARSRDRNYLNGYEWRIGLGSGTQPQASLPLLGLQFYPLTVERVSITTANAVGGIEVIGRLQLPLAGTNELDTLSNAVKLTFSLTGTVLSLSNIALVSDVGQWPLALHDGAAGSAPQLFWSNLTFDATTATLRLGTVALRFFLFDEEWSIRFPAGAIFPTVQPLTTGVTDQGTGGQPVLVAPEDVKVTLNLASGSHQASVGVRVLLGTVDRQIFRARLDYNLLSPAAPPRWTSATIFRGLNIRSAVIAGQETSDPPQETLRAGSRSLQFSWTFFGTQAANPQFLPGMHMFGREAPGFACFTFDVLPPALSANATPVDVRICTLSVSTAVVEALIRCAWGAFLQSPTVDPQPEEDFRRVLGSSAGGFTIGFTSQLRGGNLDEVYLLNGCLEVKNLISWPTQMQTVSNAGQPAVRLPAVRPGPGTHIRHSIRVLLNQLNIGRELLAVGTGDLLFTLAPGRTWQFLAVVEHQLVDVTRLATGDFAVRNDKRWTVVQEVRIANPGGSSNSARSFLAAFDVEQRGDVPGGFARRALGYLQPSLRRRLVDALDQFANSGDALIVEASAPHLVFTGVFAGQTDASSSTRQAASHASLLQLLPDGSQSAILAGEGDYTPNLGQSKWQLITTPFLGRLQPRDRDGMTPGTAADGPPGIDPILALERTAAGAEFNKLALVFANFGGQTAVDIPISNFDRALARSFARLDPASLAESLLGFHNPPPEAVPRILPSVMATLPDSPALLSRPTALAQAFRLAASASPEVSGPVVWRNDSFLLMEAAAPADFGTSPYGWHAIGLQWKESGLRNEIAGTAPERRPAATIVPVRAIKDASAISLTVSPYLGLDFLRADPAERTTTLAASELLCADGSGALTTVASRLWEGTLDTATVTAWAQETHARVCPTSSVGVIRLREIQARKVPGGPTQPQLTVRYSFALLASTQPREGLARRTFRLRSQVSALRFREAQFGGTRISSATLAPFEIAPPQVTGVQPLYLPERAWSGLRISVAYTKDLLGVAATGQGTLWWQAPEHAVQFRPTTSNAAPSNAASPAAGLPPNFRAPAIKSLRPVATLPPASALTSADLNDSKPWQPILPGGLRVLLTGNRPGAMVALRHHLIRQTGFGEAAEFTVGGSVPVQHRMPRPVPLPVNNQQDRAVRPWASFFEPASSSRSKAVPFDEAFFAGSPNLRVVLEIASPPGGMADGMWDGVVKFNATSQSSGSPQPALASWEFAASLEIGDSVLGFGPAAISTVSGEPPLAFLIADRVALSARLGSRKPGSVATIRVRVKRTGATDGFFQILSFPLRVSDRRAEPLPLEPRFVLFEDPEYNRQLASATAEATGIAKPTPDQVRQVRLAADRKQYNPDSVATLRWNWDGDSAESGTLVVARKTPAGVKTRLFVAPPPDGQSPETDEAREARKVTAAPRGSLQQFAIANLGALNSISFRLGDALEFTLTVKGTPLVLTTEIVKEPVIPAPLAAYALLRRYGANSPVECVRFAWGPRPARTEMVSPDDLDTGVVRRRAVFQWSDSPRRGRSANYEVQKIGANGSTHIPEFP